METQTELSGRTYCFTTETCMELIGKLVGYQLDRELKSFGMDDETICNLTVLKKKELLQLNLHDNVCYQTPSETTNKLTKLTQLFSRSANDTMTDLKKSLEDAKDLVSSLQKLDPATHPPPTLPKTAVTETSHVQDIEEQPFIALDSGSFLERFEFEKLNSELTFEYSFANRKVAYFGDLPYKYTGGYHKKKDLPNDSYLTEILLAVADMCKSNDIDYSEFNSFMVTKYDTPDDYIPPHSDDEQCIARDSNILTVSIGGAREVVFRRRPPGEYRKHSLTVKHGECYVMSRKSQDSFDHAVPQVDPDNFDRPRISITLRKLTPNIPQIPANEPQRPKRVLVLSDSKNSSFDCSKFKAPVVAFRENLFLLRDLEEHKESIKSSDIVLISAGVNDMRKNGVNARILHDHVRNFVAQYPKTQFLFDSVTNVTMNADPYNALNPNINFFNRLMFKCSLRHANIHLFDNLAFGWGHLARDGLHFNYSGQKVTSDTWVHVVLVCLGLRRGPLPLRYDFVKLHEEFQSWK